MTPADTALFVDAWNAAKAAESGEVPAMSLDELDDLMRQYPDG